MLAGICSRVGLHGFLSVDWSPSRRDARVAMAGSEWIAALDRPFRLRYLFRVLSVYSSGVPAWLDLR